MNAMQILLPPDELDAQTYLDRLASVRLAPFDVRVKAFLADFATRLLADHTLRSKPELVALGYWFRPAAIATLEARHAALAHHGLLRPRGVVFHVAPSNVDAVFVYSWFLALLCGNRNIVRLSQRASAPRAALLALLAGALTSHPDIAAANLVLAYPRDDATSAELSARCQLRVVWGGNDTVSHFRSITLPPLATELVFPDRQAWAALDAQAVLHASEEALSRLAAAFYNDAFWFAQQACSSPRAVLWIGDQAAVSAAQARFWPALQTQLAHRGVQDEPAQLAARLVAAHRIAASGAARATTPLAAWPLRLQADRFDADARAAHCGYGLFIEIARPSLDAASGLFSDADQTLAYFGFSAEQLRDWALALADRAIDRIVPIGEALRFADRWDGHDLLMAFSRLVVIA
jgi:hypothetical protein